MSEDLKRLSRLASILTQLQSKTLITASSLAKKFDVNVRTIYRDIKALEEAGVPIMADQGRGYSIVDGYHIPPVMFTEREAFSLVTAEQIIKRDKDASFVKAFSEAITKIKAVLRNHSKDKAEILEERIYVGKNAEGTPTSASLIDIQVAITETHPIDIGYASADGTVTDRIIEPYMLYHSVSENWVLVAYCRLRTEFRSFRIDRIKRHQVQATPFEANKKAFKQFISEKFID
jgi:predicted DNA-binding transcriptional regulator YafY